VKGIFGKYIEKLPTCLNELNIGGYRYFWKIFVSDEACLDMILLMVLLHANYVVYFKKTHVFYDY
jgi:hypothetical protein